MSERVDRNADGGSGSSGPDRAWWKEAVVYQIYPRSFNDSDGDGIGDIPGILEKVDHLDDLGVDVVWLCPVYESPNADNGYDIADYRAIADDFGEMADWEKLVDALHDRDIKLVMDLVVNHTSDEHAWFKRSKAEPESDYRDYYFWREGRPVVADADTNADDAFDSAGTDASGTGTDADGTDVGGLNELPPNNWESLFGGSAWTYDEATEEWYLHLFDEKQADLNWENPQVREEVFEVMEWWLDKGIDGFRMDVINLISKTEGLPDGEEGTWATGAEHFAGGPRLSEHLTELAERALADRDAMTVGEMVGVTVSHAREYIETGAVDMIFHFEHMSLDRGEQWWDVGEWSLVDLREVFSRWQEGLYPAGWNALYLGNHDQPRIVSRFGSEAYRGKSAKLLATFLCTLRGTPFIYQGDEIGMTNVPFESLDQYRDIATLTPIRAAIDEGVIGGFKEIRNQVRQRSRDNARTPMQWNSSTNAGFTDGEPWIGVNRNHEKINVDAAKDDPDSIYGYYKDVIALRKAEDVLVYGEYDPLYSDHEEIYAYTRTLETEGEDGTARTERALVVLNFSDGTPTFEVPDGIKDGLNGAELLIANYEVETGDEGDGAVDAFELRPLESRVYRL